MRVTNKEAELVLKYGGWSGGDARREILIPIPLDKFEEAVDFLKYLGWTCGVFMNTNRFIFDYKGIEFALIKLEGFNSFEAEKISSDTYNSEEILKELEETCLKLGLEVFSEKEFVGELNKLNERPGAKFDFTKDKFEDIKERFKEYF